MAECEFAHQDGLGQDGDDEAAGEDAQVLGQELGGHDEAGGADEEGKEKLLEGFQLVQCVLLLLRRAHHHPCHKRAQLRRQPLRE